MVSVERPTFAAFRIMPEIEGHYIDSSSQERTEKVIYRKMRVFNVFIARFDGQPKCRFALGFHKTDRSDIPIDLNQTQFLTTTDLSTPDFCQFNYSQHAPVVSLTVGRRCYVYCNFKARIHKVQNNIACTLSKAICLNLLIFLSGKMESQ